MAGKGGPYKAHRDDLARVPETGPGDAVLDQSKSTKSLNHACMFQVFVGGLPQEVTTDVARLSVFAVDDAPGVV